MTNTLSLSQTDPLVAIVNSITELVSPEKIFLLSVIRQVNESENIFLQRPVTARFIHAVHLLVLAAERETRPTHELQDSIEHHAPLPVELTAFVLPVHQFNRWITNNHPFALTVYRHSRLLYDAGLTQLAIPDGYKTLTASPPPAGSGMAVLQAAEFICGAELFIIRKQYALAVFHLHQAAEQVFSSIILYTTGLRVQTHNLDKLFRYSQHVLPELQTIFPRNTGPEKELFRCLQKAYTEGRYNKDFTVRFMIVSQLLERIKKLLAICKTIPYQNTVNT